MPQRFKLSWWQNFRAVTFRGKISCHDVYGEIQCYNVKEKLGLEISCQDVYGDMQCHNILKYPGATNPVPCRFRGKSRAETFLTKFSAATFQRNLVAEFPCRAVSGGNPVPRRLWENSVPHRFTEPGGNKSRAVTFRREFPC